MKLANNRDISESLQKTLNTKNLFDLYVENWTKEKRDEFRAKFSVDGENGFKSLNTFTSGLIIILLALDIFLLESCKLKVFIRIRSNPYNKEPVAMEAFLVNV